MEPKVKTGFFQESPGENSMSRLGFFGITLFAMVMTVLVFVGKQDYNAALATFSAIEGFAVGLKIFSKGQENSMLKYEEEHKL